MVTRRTIAPVFAALSLLTSLETSASGHLMLHPTRVVFEGKTRTAEVDLINNGSEEATFRIYLVNERMTDHGEFVVVETPQAGEHFADELVRFSPRQVTLAPGGGQLVRLQLRKPANLPAGEYRTHLMFKALPPSQAQQSNTPDAVEHGFRTEVTAVVSISIPIIVRQDETSAALSFAAVKLVPSKNETAVLSFTLQRQGSRSVYGDIVVSFTPRGGAELIVGRANGVAVYVPNEARMAEIPLQLSPNQRLANGRIHVSFLDRPESGGKLLAESTLDLP
jgi:P pilus assembly chaperone PapD